MANLYDNLASPESGFTRYNQNGGFYYTGSWAVRGWGRYSKTKDASVEIYLKNVSKIRFITLTERGCATDGQVYINDNLSPYIYSSEVGLKFECFILELSLSGIYSKIKLLNPKTKQMNFSYIDINSNGKVVSKEEFIENYRNYHMVYNRNNYYNKEGTKIILNNNEDLIKENAFILPIYDTSKLSFNHFLLRRIDF